MQTSKLILKRITFAVTGVLLLVTLPLYAWKVWEKTDYTDFEVYYRAASRAHLQQWAEVYSLKDGASPFRYAPSWIPFFELFVNLPISQARVLWYLLQFFWFGLGFYFLYRTVLVCKKPRDRSHAAWVTCIGILFILRFCLDTFTIGQVSSLMFLGFCIGLYAWVLRRPGWSAAGIWIPTFLKIGPGFLLGVFLSARKREIFKGFLGSLLAIGLFVAIPAWIIKARSGTTEIISMLWKNWAHIVSQDSQYYDASHYGSQSLKSALLRAVKFHWISAQTADSLYFGVAGLLCLGVSAFWFLRKPKSLYGRGLFFTLGLFVYIWAMPETFKYSFTPLAIPVVLLLLKRRPDFLTVFSLSFGALTLSLAGKDIVGDTLFFGSQYYSIPFLATTLLGLAVFRQAWKESFPSPIARSISYAWNSGKPKLGPWETVPMSKSSLDVSILLPLPLGKDYFLDTQLVRNTLLDFTQMRGHSSDVEILVIPYGDRLSDYHPALKEVKALQSQIPNLKILTQNSNNSSGQISPTMIGRGSALRTGFLQSQGKKIYISQIEQPCRVDFYEKADLLLTSKNPLEKVDLVRANRRLEATRFRIPVKHLGQVYSRHRLGIVFNQWVRKLLPIQTTDILSGNLALSRRLASQVFAVQTCPDFLFDLEVGLTALSNHFPEKDLPVMLSLSAEKTFKRILFESLSILRSLPVLAWRYRKGYYGLTTQSLPNRIHPTAITADDWGLSPGVNQGILKLCQLGVVRRVSIMANCAHLETHLKDLLSIPGVELGLHFNLTYGKPLQRNPQADSPLIQKNGNMIPSPGRFLLKWINPLSNKQANRNHVRAEFLSQIARLQELQIPISYIDGHHHIHLVPGLLEAISDLIQTTGIKKVRLPYDQTLWKSSKAPLALLALLARNKMLQFGFESLPCIYPQSMDFLDQGRLRARLIKQPHAEVIVHPAEINDLHLLEVPDSYTSGRIIEYQALRMLAPEIQSKTQQDTQDRK